MAVYSSVTLSGFRVTGFENNNLISEPTEIRLTTSLNYSFEYSIAQPGDGNEVSVIALINEIGTTHFFDLGSNASLSMGTFQWGDQQETEFFLAGRQTEDGTLEDNLFVIGGSPVDDLSEVLESVEAVIGSVASFPAEQPITFGNFPPATVIETDRIIGNDEGNAIIGSGQDDLVFGLNGDDFIRGEDGADTISGGSGRDEIIAGSGDDMIEGGSGADVIFGNKGLDTITFQTAKSSIAFDLGAGVGTLGNAKGDQYSSIENAIGSDFADSMTGSAQDNRLNGERGADTLLGMEGDDILIGGGGADTLDGGIGTDTASYETAASGVSLDLSQGNGSVGNANGDTFISIENLLGSAFDDKMTGDDAANIIDGSDGNDLIRGRKGEDTIIGGAGDDMLFGGGGADQFIFRADDGADDVGGFNVSLDTIMFENSAITSLESIDISETAAGLVLDYGSGTVTILGLGEADIASVHFEFL